MFDYYLKFTDEIEALTVLEPYSTANENITIHVIGTAQKLIGYEADGETPILQSYDGYFVAAV